MQVDGKGRSGVMFVAEALGGEEANKGIAMVGPAGYTLWKIIRKFVKLERDDFWWANTIFCQPPKNHLAGAWYEQKAIEHCAPNLDEAIHRLKPKAIVAFGAIASQRLTGHREIMDVQTYAFWNEGYQCWVVPAVHPSFVMRGNSSYQPVVGQAINKAVRIAKEGYNYERLETIHEPTALELEALAEEYFAALEADPSLVLAADIETNYKKGKDEADLDELSDPDNDITQVSFSWDGKRGVAAAWAAQNIPIIKQIFATKGQKVFWNKIFDVPRLEVNGVVFGGPVRDSMSAWHVLQSNLRKGLGFVTPLVPENHRVPYWKGAVQQDGGWWYSAMDSILLWRNDRYIIQHLKEQGSYECFHKFVEEIEPVLDDMEAAGVLIDVEARDKWAAEVKAKMDGLVEQMQQHVPQEIRNINPKEGYKKDPPEGEREGMMQITIPNQTWKRCPVCFLKNPTKPHFKEYRAKAHLHKNTMCSGFVAEEVKGDEIRWAQVLPFVPSSQQLLRYARHRNYRIRTNYKTGNPTMDKEAIERMLKKHPGDPLFRLITEHRKLQKEYGLYGPDGKLAGPDGRAHTHFSSNPSTLRFASYGPNLQNIPRPPSVIRGFFVSGPGQILGARDFSGIEAVCVGYLAMDKDYVRLAMRGVHDYFNAHMAYERGELLASDLPDLSWPDDQLGAYLGELKVRLEATRNTSKKGVHMSNYLGTPMRMYTDAPGLFPGGIKDAKRVQDLYFEVFPSIKIWHEKTLRNLERYAYIRSPWGFVQRFFHVFDYEKNEDTGTWEPKLGPDAKDAIAAGPQHMAAMVMRRSIYDLKDTEWRQYLRLTIHDELLWECPEERIDEVDAAIAEVMERPNLHLPLDPEWGMGTHLAFGTEGKRGHRWLGMKKSR